MDTAGATEEIQRLRARVKELETELRSRRSVVTGRGGKAAGGALLRLVNAVLVVTTLVMAPAAFITVRRWLQWWRHG
jgi:hypothetical protein